MSIQTACIYCGAPANSGEHWLPRGFGAFKGLTRLRDRVCTECNNALGQDLDEQLLRTGLTGFSRQAAGIQGRSKHAKVSVFHYRAGEALPPTTLLLPAPDGVGKILGEVVPDATYGKSGRPLRQLIFKRSNGERVCIPFPPAWNAEQIKGAIREYDVEGAELVEVYMGPDESPDSCFEMRRVLTDALGTFSALARYGADEKVVEKPTELHAYVTTKYLRGLAKIGFHYFLWSSGAWRGDEHEFEPLRDFIKRGTGNSQEFVEVKTRQFILQLEQKLVPAHKSHFFFAEVNRTEALARIQFFVGPGALPPPSLIRLGRSPSRLHGRFLSAHRVWYYDDKSDGYDGEIETLDVTPRRIIVRR
jgi:hypothetical protein